MVNVKHRGTSKHNHDWLAKYLFNPATALYVFAVFITFTLLMGGGARDDIQSLIILRPLAILFAAYAIIYKLEVGTKWNFFPLKILITLAAFIIIQLIPLPPDIWTLLPQRQVFAEIATTIGIDQPWRPISLSPSESWNSLFSLSVPLTASILFLNIAPRDRRRAILMIIMIIAASAVWAILQILGPSNGPMYLYNYTNNGVAVGFFANRNHQAVMLTALILFLGWYSIGLQRRTSVNPINISAVIGGILILVPLIFITGSRAGLILMIPALGSALYFLYCGNQLKEKKKTINTNPKKQKNWLDLIKLYRSKIIFTSVVIAIIALAISSVIFSRSLAYDRLFSNSSVAELRTLITPILLTMSSDFIPLGSGMGSFEHIYRYYEPNDLLRPQYLNQAHNDWLQFIIEGGLFAIAIIIAVFSWTSRQIWTLIIHWKQAGVNRYTALMCIVYFMIIAAASLGDYPLRVPITMLVSMVLATYFALKMQEIRDTI